MIRIHESHWAIFISGRGSNMQALFDLCEDIRVRVVVSSTAKAPGLLKAKRHGIPTLILDKKINWENLSCELKRRGVQKIFLLGFMKLIPESFIQNWSGQILNLHPSLLPAYPGLEAIEKSYFAGAAMGATIHVVVPEMDAGPIVLQKQCMVRAENLKHEISLDEAKLRVSYCEQQLVREAALKWN